MNVNVYVFYIVFKKVFDKINNILIELLADSEIDNKNVRIMANLY